MSSRGLFVDRVFVPRAARLGAVARSGGRRGGHRRRRRRRRRHRPEAPRRRARGRVRRARTLNRVGRAVHFFLRRRLVSRERRRAGADGGARAGVGNSDKRNSDGDTKSDTNSDIGDKQQHQTAQRRHDVSGFIRPNDPVRASVRGARRAHCGVRRGAVLPARGSRGGARGGTRVGRGRRRRKQGEEKKKNRGRC